MERFFKEIGVFGDEEATVELAPQVTEALAAAEPQINTQFKICPDCNERTLKSENGCDTCINPNCGYSKCDK